MAKSRRHMLSLIQAKSESVYIFSSSSFLIIMNFILVARTEITIRILEILIRFKMIEIATDRENSFFMLLLG